MRISSALLWEIGGEPHRDEVLISDEGANGSGAELVVLDRDGQRRAASPDELPKGSVLLLPPELSDEDLATVHRAGYTARRSDLTEPEGDAGPAGATDTAPSSRQAAIAAADAELEQVTARLEENLRRRHPELFDAGGRLRPREYERRISGRIDGKRALTREDVLGLGKDRTEPKGKATGLDAP